MRFFVVALAAAAALATTATAQTPDAAPAAPIPPSACPEIAPGPTPPSGAEASTADFNAGVAAYEAWRGPVQEALSCRAREANALQAQAQARVHEYQEARASVDALVASWQTEAAAAQARRGNRRR